MPFNGSGTYTFPAGSFNPAVNGNNATAADWNALIADLATAVSKMMARDGQSTVTANIPFATFRATGMGDPVAAQDAATKNYVLANPRSYLAGFGLSNDGVTPNTILDIAAGFCLDSTSAFGVTGAAFTKSTAGSWAAGSGGNGMGNGLTIANSTWYHVFAIINAGAYDVYFDTSATAANKPANTTASRRIGSFKTDSSAHILAFVQLGDLFQWATAVADITANNPGIVAVTATLSVPIGINAQAWFRASIRNSSTGGNAFAIFSDLATADISPVGGACDLGPANNQAGTSVENAGQFYIRTNTSSQIRYRSGFSDGSVTMFITTLGWIDTRGKS